MAAPGMFSALYNGYNGTLINGSTTAADALLNAAAPELAAGLGLFVIVNGVLVMLHKLQWNTAVLNCVRALAVANLLTVALYNQYVETMFLTTVPNWIGAAIGGGGGGGNIAQQLDNLHAAVAHMAAVLMAANTGISPTMIANRICIFLSAQFSEIALLGVFIVFFLAACLMAVTAPLGAVVMIAYLFENTRRWAIGWVGKLVALSLLELLTGIELAIVLTQFAAYMGNQEAASASGIDNDQLIDNLFGIGCSFWFGAIVMICLPAIAAAIGGSHVSNVVVTHVNMATGAVRTAATSLASRAGLRPAPTSKST